MRHLFSWYTMIPISILFCLLNGIYGHGMDAEILYIGTAIIGFGSIILALIYGIFIQGAGTLVVDKAKYFGIAVYLFFGISCLCFLLSTGNETELTDETTRNLTYIFQNMLFPIAYGTLGIIWSLASRKTLRNFKRLPKEKDSYLKQVKYKH